MHSLNLANLETMWSRCLYGAGSISLSFMSFRTKCCIVAGHTFSFGDVLKNRVHPMADDEAPSALDKLLLSKMSSLSKQQFLPHGTASHAATPPQAIPGSLTLQKAFGQSGGKSTRSFLQIAKQVSKAVTVGKGGKIEK
jgi:hypothetical protein